MIQAAKYTHSSLCEVFKENVNKRSQGVKIDDRICIKPIINHLMVDVKCNTLKNMHFIYFKIISDWALCQDMPNEVL